VTVQSEVDVVILGAGITGLSTSKRLMEMGIKNLVLEQDSKKGGHLRSFGVGDFAFDEGPHILFSKDTETLEFLGSPDPESYEMEASVGAIYKNQHMNHPAYLHFSSMKNRWMRERIRKSILRSSQNKENRNYRDWVVSNFGQYVNRRFTEVYTRKYWRVSNEALGLDWVNARIHQVTPNQRARLQSSKLSEIDLTEDSHYLTRYTYSPLGFFSLFPELHNTAVSFNNEVIKIDTKRKEIITNTGKYRYKYLISTLPLDKLSEATGLCTHLANQLKVTSIYCSSLVFKLKTSIEHPYHWVYLYDRDTPISRVSFPSRFTKKQDGKTFSVQTEEYFMKNHEKPSHQSISKIVKMLKKKRLIPMDAELLNFDQRIIPYANIVPTLGRAEIVAEMKSIFEKTDIFLCGRFGSWEYLWSVESAVSGIKIAERIRAEVVKPGKQKGTKIE
jgi:protoporphyrinogen oxidase